MRDRCKTWPDCICADHWRRRQSIDDEWAPTEEEFRSALTITTAMLACVAKRCPDGRARAHATVQLMHPIFAEGDRA